MRVASTAGLTLDTGALLALDRPSTMRAMKARLDEARAHGESICVPVGVVAQAWRSPRQVRLARMLKSPGLAIVSMTLGDARRVGALCAVTGHDDVVDVHIALCARQRRHAVVTSDPDDFAHIDPALPVIRV
jgi:predicted nucleic acid-binding protein